MSVIKPATPEDTKKDLSDAEDFEKVAIPPVDNANELILEHDSEEDCDLVEDCEQSVEKKLTFLEDALAKALHENEKNRKEKRHMGNFYAFSILFLFGSFAISLRSTRPESCNLSSPKAVMASPQCPACPELVVPSCPTVPVCPTVPSCPASKPCADEYIHQLGEERTVTVDCANIKIMDRFISDNGPYLYLNIGDEIRRVDGVQVLNKHEPQIRALCNREKVDMVVRKNRFRFHGVAMAYDAGWETGFRLVPKWIGGVVGIIGVIVLGPISVNYLVDFIYTIICSIWARLFKGAAKVATDSKVNEASQKEEEPEAEQKVEPLVPQSEEVVEPKEEKEEPQIADSKPVNPLEELARLQEQIDEIKKSIRTETII